MLYSEKQQNKHLMNQIRTLLGNNNNNNNNNNQTEATEQENSTESLFMTLIFEQYKILLNSSFNNILDCYL